MSPKDIEVLEKIKKQTLIVEQSIQSFIDSMDKKLIEDFIKIYEREAKKRTVNPALNENKQDLLMLLFYKYKDETLASNIVGARHHLAECINILNQMLLFSDSPKIAATMTGSLVVGELRD